MKNVITALRNSVILQLSLVLAMTALLMNTVVWHSFHRALEGHDRRHFDSQFNRYFDYVASDIASKHDPFARASELAHDLSLSIEIQGKNAHWRSDPEERSDPRPKLFARAGPAHRPPAFSYERQMPSGDATIVIRPLRGPHFPKEYEALLQLLVTLSILMFLSYLLIRGWILRPLNSLKAAVAAFGQGDLEHPIPHAGANELGKLGDALRDMASRIREMMESKRQLLLDVSHELRSPLTRARLALEFVGEGEPRRQILEEIEELDHLIGTLLEEARLRSGHALMKREPTDLVAIARQLAQKLSADSNPVHIAEAPSQVVISADTFRIRTLLRNLLDNAIKYSPAGAPVEIAIRSRTDSVLLIVTDHGVGIPAIELERVFEPFYRVDRSRTRATGGFGLGLSLCARIAKAHGGSIHLESEEGRFTRAIVELPRS